MSANKIPETILVLDNVRSVMNVGSMFRTANAIGIKKIYLCGITPSPLDNYGRERKDFLKVSLGAEKTIEWKYVSSTLDCVKKLHSEGYTTIAIEQHQNAIDYKDVDISGKEKVVFIMGSEVDGVSKEVLKEVPTIAEIPMLGNKESLNVVIAFGVAVYRILKI